MSVYEVGDKGRRMIYMCNHRDTWTWSRKPYNNESENEVITQHVKECLKLSEDEETTKDTPL